MKCIYCGKPIQSKRDLVIGVNLIIVTFPGPLNSIEPHHIICFSERNKKLGGSFPLASLDIANLQNRGKSERRTILVFFIGYFFMLGVTFWLGFGITLWWVIGTFVGWCLLLLFVPIKNLIYLNKIEKLPEN